MTLKPILTLSLALGLSLSACTEKKKVKSTEGTPITAEFLKKYAGKFADDQGETVEIALDGKIRIRQIRQIGDENSPVPPQTVCTYYEEGRITGVFDRFAAKRAAYIDYADTLINVSITKVSLDTSPGAKQETLENCNKMVAIGKRVGNYSFYTELLDANKFRFHTSGGADYKNGGERTQSTLDEVFQRTQ